MRSGRQAAEPDLDRPVEEVDHTKFRSATWSTSRACSSERAGCRKPSTHRRGHWLRAASTLSLFDKKRAGSHQTLALYQGGVLCAGCWGG
jgi:hypothetical protein